MAVAMEDRAVMVVTVLGMVQVLGAVTALAQGPVPITAMVPVQALVTGPEPVLLLVQETVRDN